MSEAPTEITIDIDDGSLSFHGEPPQDACYTFHEAVRYLRADHVKTVTDSDLALIQKQATRIAELERALQQVVEAGHDVPEKPSQRANSGPAVLPDRAIAQEQSND